MQLMPTAIMSALTAPTVMIRGLFPAMPSRRVRLAMDKVPTYRLRLPILLCQLRVRAKSAGVAVLIQPATATGKRMVAALIFES